MTREGRPIKQAGSAGGRPPHTDAPLPLERAIAWSPRGTEEGGVRAGWPRSPYPIFLEQDVIAGVNRHLDREEREPRFGFLLGRLFRSPGHEIDYAVVDTAVAAREVLSEEASGAYLIRAWSEAQAVFSGHSGLLLGWYHSHYRLGLMPSEADLDTNARYFDAPWQLSIVIVPDRARPLGGVFRHAPATGRRDRPRPSPFYELIREPHGGDIGNASSAVTWANYEAQLATPPPATASREPRITPWDGEGTPRRDGRVAMPATGAPDRGGPPGGVSLVMPGDKADTSLLPPRSRRVAWPVVVGAALAIAAALFFLLSDGPTSRPEPDRPTAATSGEGGVPADVERFIEQVEALEIAGERYAERAADFDAGRIGCDLLTTGYVAADEAYVRIAASFRDLESRSNPRAARAYERAGQEMADVNGHFDGSGCPRP